MPHAFRMFKAMSDLGFAQGEALAVGGLMEISRHPDTRFDGEACLDRLCEGGFAEEAAEAVASALRHCFLSEKATAQYERTKLKTALVRGGIAAAKADAFLTTLEGSVVTRRTAEVRRPVPHAPSPGRVVMCDFTYLVKPEMQKERRAIVVSSRSAGAAGRCTVVPVSKSPPRENNTHHFRFEPGTYPFFHQTDPVWAVCDHIYTVSLVRLWQVNVNRRPALPSISPAELAGIRALLGTVLGLDH
ncbi:type II toxin-antitoxin system PemK/MazF family toxin [Methylorubrum aminovorans]|uniref:type II toxin-antitoxin system PemK/MazF family toxin n=1 Tax=Methylorubrum aminovorans TaxID=269069 RepID=UPI00034CFE31